MTVNRNHVEENIQNKLSRFFSVSIEEADANQIYKATVLTVRDILAQKRKLFNAKTREQGNKKVYYMCMEFLMGTSLRTNLNNLGIEAVYREVLKNYGFDLDSIYEMESDPGLGNGGLGRLAACFMDSLSTLSYPARGYSILYEYGLFKQKLAEGEQIELPDIWMPGGDAWLVPRQDKACVVRFGGNVTEKWDNGRCEIIHDNYEEVEAIPYDMLVSGADSEAITTLRLWKAQDIRNFNMELFSQGQYIKAVEDNTMAQTISKVLYPNDNHPEGKLLRLSQQYFLVSASLQNIIQDHIAVFKNLNTLPEK
ncbi:MAG: glycogen/starch/alpha-glucan phosphorylase, partial [Clostridia bacterium]|nr:glycogen/starch/alpha-glucan phosphorylase [Clostridia bacterium]